MSRGVDLTRSTHPGRRSGIALIYCMIIFSVLGAFVSFAVDWGRVQLVKTELQNAATAAARAAAAQLANGITATQNAAVTYGGYNNADGSTVTINATDVEFGTWDSNAATFTVLTGTARTGANAVRVTASRTAAKGTAINLYFASLIGKSSIDVTATATATQGSSLGLIGLDGITIHKNFWAASYNSGTTTTPTHTVYRTNTAIQSNGQIGITATGTANHIYGTATLGLNGSLDSNMTVHGTTTYLGADIATPSTPTMTVVTNPGGVSQTPNVNANVTWQAGTYYFTSLSVSDDKDIHFSGAATIYLNGNANLGKKINFLAYNSIPSNLKIYIASGKTFTATDDFVFIGQMYGPAAYLDINNNCDMRGSLFFKSMSFHDGCDLYYDEALGAGGSGSGVATVK